MIVDRFHDLLFSSIYIYLSNLLCEETGFKAITTSFITISTRKLLISL